MKGGKRVCGGAILFPNRTKLIGIWTKSRKTSSNGSAAGSDNTDLVAKVINQFLNDEATNKALINNEDQFTNNKKVNTEIANAGRSCAFLGGQNDTKIWVGMAEDIQFRFPTIYDQACNEKIQGKFREYLTKEVTREKAVTNFYDAMLEAYPNLKVGK